MTEAQKQMVNDTRETVKAGMWHTMGLGVYEAIQILKGSDEDVLVLIEQKAQESGCDDNGCRSVPEELKNIKVVDMEKGKVESYDTDIIKKWLEHQKINEIDYEKLNNDLEQRSLKTLSDLHETGKTTWTVPKHEEELLKEMNQQYNEFVPWKKNVLLPELEIWPVTIVADRYNGQYSGGKWLALNWNEEFVPRAIQGSDSECMDFFESTELIIGKGNTPNEALTDLYNKLQNGRESEEE